MSTNERDTHFLGFAKLFVDDTQVLGFKTRAEFETYIAQRAYDLAYHFIESNYQHRGTFRGEIHASVQMLPDLTAWPDS